LLRDRISCRHQKQRKKNPNNPVSFTNPGQ
jgi:hypothetical protein